MRMNIEILRVDGTRSLTALNIRDGQDAITQIHALIGCDTGDTVNLRDGRVMCVDDNGWECETIDHGNGHIEMKPVRALKPINEQATKIYQALRPGTPNQIAGDVVIAWDEDFA